MALNSFSLFLVTCRNAMENIDHMDELHNSTNMRVIISKLPFKLHERGEPMLITRKCIIGENHTVGGLC